MPIAQLSDQATVDEDRIDERGAPDDVILRRHERGDLRNILLRAGNRLTGGGISSGLDEALKLVSLLFGDESAKAVQVTTQYFPKPPVMGVIPPAPACPIHWD